VSGHRRLALTKRNQQKLKENLHVLVPGQGRLAISRSRVPNLDGAVTTGAGNLLSIGAPRHWFDTVFVRSQHTNQQKQRGKLEKNLLMRVPGHRRLEISRLRVPNLDGFVPTTAGNLLSIGAPRHWHDPEIERSQETNQQKQKGKNRKKLTRTSARSASTRIQKCQSIPPTRSSPSCHSCRWPAYHPCSMQPTSTCNCEKSANESTETEKKKLGKKNVHARVAGHRALVNVHLETFYIYVIFKRVFINNKWPIRVVYLTGTQKRNMFLWILF